MIYVVIDVGCHECHVASEKVGIYADKGEALRALEAREEEFGGWRDGGQSIPELFEFEGELDA